MDKEVELYREDFLVLKLCQVLAEWVGVEPTDFKIYTNRLLPIQENEVPFRELRAVDAENQCLLHAVMTHLDSIQDELDEFNGTLLAYIIQALRAAAYTWASRQAQVKPGHTIYWAIRRHKGMPWWIKVEPSDEQKIRDILTGGMG